MCLQILRNLVVGFFFSSRRRHTRYWRDWSSDVCSSDLWPTRPVTIVSPFAAGSGIGLLARNVGNELAGKVGQSFVVEDRAGANGNVAAAAVAKAEPDGHTMLVGTPGTLVQNKYVYKTMTYDPDRDFAAIVLISKAPMLITINPKLPVNTLPELIAYAKANPGKISVGTSGIGSQGHITLELLKRLAGVEMTHVPYRTTAQANTDIISGQIQAGINYVTTATGPVRDGLMRALVISSKTRSRQLPDVPTSAEAGFPGFESTGWYGLMAPRGTPVDVIRRINTLVNAYVAGDKGVKQLDDLGMEPAGGTPEDLAAWIRREDEQWGPII